MSAFAPPIPRSARGGTIGTGGSSPAGSVRTPGGRARSGLPSTRLLLRAISSGPTLMRCPGGCPTGACPDHDDSIMGAPAGSQAVEAPPQLEAEVAAIRRGGSPMEASARSLFEQRFGRDFGAVRIHTDARAARSAEAAHAVAYTVGNDVVFAPGRYHPSTAEGRALIAHELAHVVQQRAGNHRGQRLTVAPSADPLEQEADAAARAFAEGGTAVVRGQAMPGRIQGQGSLSCALVNDPVTGMPTCVNMGGCVGTCVLHNNFPLPPFCSCRPSGAAVPPPIVPIPLPTVPPVPAPTPTPTPAPTPSPPPPATLTGLTVTNQRSAIAYEEPGTGGPHFVTVAGTTGDENVVVEATTSRPLVPPESITWTFDPPVGGLADADPLRALVSRRRAKRVKVTGTLGGTSLSLTVWALFTQVRRVGAIALGFSPPAGAPPGSACTGAAGTFCAFGRINFDGEVFPHDLTAPGADRPSFARPPVPPPGGVNSCGLALAGGIAGRFDMSRQIGAARVDPAGLIGAAGFCPFIPRPFPADNAEGNDDANVGDEKDNPFAAGVIPLNGRAVARGFVGSVDVPSIRLPHAVGVAGNTVEVHLTFREFARVEYHSTWWLMSNRAPWEVHFRLRKDAANHWVDNGSTVA